MAIFEWQDSLFTGVAQIDEHHLHLVDLLNETHRNFLRNASPNILAELFEELIDYATYHFAAEEKIMVENGYPEIRQHLLEHVKFSTEVIAMNTNYLNRQKPFFLEIFTFLHNWLKTHILQTDSKLGRFLAEK